MKKYLGITFAIMAFVSFVTYATVQTKSYQAEIPQEETVQQIEPAVAVENNDGQEASFAIITPREAPARVAENFVTQSSVLEDSSLVTVPVEPVEQLQPIIQNPIVSPDDEPGEKFDTEDGHNENRDYNEEENEDDD